MTPGAAQPIPEPEPVSVQLIGGFRLCEGGRDATPRGRKGRALLAALALSENGAASRDRLTALLWGDRAEEQARASLRQCLTELRGGLLGQRGLLTVGRDQVALALDAVGTDLASLLAAAASGNLKALLRHFSVGSIDLLSGLDGLSPGFDEWLLVERARRRDMIVSAAIAAVAHALDRPDREPVAGLIAELERLEPGNEQVVRLGLRADRAAGDLGSLHRRYQRLADVLRDEYGSAPSAETKRLFETLRSGSAAPAPATIVPPPVEPGDNEPPLLHIGEFVDATQGAYAHLAVTLRQEILSGLSRFRDLRLAIERDVSDAGGYRLTATIRSSASGLVITPQLVRADGELVWADRLDQRLDDLQAGVDLLIARMVAAILPAVMTDVVATIAPRPAGGLYGRYLLARYAALRPETHEAALAAARDLEAIVEADQNFVSPRLALARIYDTDFVWTRANSSGPRERSRAFELSRQALGLDRDNVNAWTHMGWSHLWHRNWAASERALNAALTLNPFNVARLLEVAVGRIYLGQFDGAAALVERSLAIEPRPGDDLHGDRGLLEFMRGNHDAAAADFAMIVTPDLLHLVHAAANAARAGADSAFARERAQAALVPLFPDQRMPALDDLLAWVDHVHPFRLDEHRRHLLDAVAL
ncbi:MAG TPA: BTAD domain-containing putative transcriptional regulator, partial [Sphingomonas sp.]|nr:BTAD domain-containing putative transcriptional regulator [Sphingomonas sp.]